MEEKKLTNEEIVKDIERSTGMPSYWKKIVLDLIRRLQYGYSSASKASEEWKAKYEAERKENARQKAEIERLTEEIKSIKEMTAEQVVESEKLKQSCAEAVNSFVRLETLYKIKCQELEIANKKLEEVKGGKTD